jgi:hypothetical protein
MIRQVWMQIMELLRKENRYTQHPTGKGESHDYTGSKLEDDFLWYYIKLRAIPDVYFRMYQKG